MRPLLLILFLAADLEPARAGGLAARNSPLATPSNVYEARVVNVIDGDTIRVAIAIWHNQVLTTSIRVRGVDTPELRGKCAEERALALKAKQFVRELLPPGARVTLTRVAPDKYGGRYDADVQTPDGTAVAASLIAAGLARQYHGASRAGWCA